jgi:hypothetical protein
MSGVPHRLNEHSLNVSKTARPIKQKLRRFTHDKKEAIRTEVTRLLAVGFIKEVYHPEWIANPILVRKNNNEWRMCADYTDLNKHCPKEPSLSLVLTGWSTLRPGVNFFLFSTVTLVITRSR